MTDTALQRLIDNALTEDIGDGDHTTLSTIPADKQGKAHLICKATGIIAGIDAAKAVFNTVDSHLSVTTFMTDGTPIKPGDIAFEVRGADRSILMAERVVLNIMQRMSGIATLTRRYVDACAGTNTKILDTRKTTPGFRLLEKQAVRIGGAYNHRFGLYDMILIKDNHIDYAGGIKPAIDAAHTYLDTHHKDLKIEIECRNFNELDEILACGRIDRILLDNLSVADATKAVHIINHRYETEISGGIDLNTVKAYAQCGADYISLGAITHSYTSLDMSLKAF